MATRSATIAWPDTRAPRTLGRRLPSAEEVAREAGMTKGAIYYHFDNKEDLLRRAVEDRHEAIFAAIESELAALEAPGSVKIRYVLRQFWGHVLEPVWGQAVRLMFGEVGIEFPALFRMWAEEGPIQGWTVVRRLIEEGVRRGEVRPGVDLEVSARLAVSGLIMQSMLQVHSGLATAASGGSSTAASQLPVATATLRLKPAYPARRIADPRVHRSHSS
jgi:TetR/AcrR family transcriptional regulator, transcriptional repressor for nem operon